MRGVLDGCRGGADGSSRGAGGTTMICFACSTPLPAGARFCSSCGTPIQLCGSCSSTVPPTAKFCPGCGAPVQTASPRDGGNSQGVAPVTTSSRGSVGRSTLIPTPTEPNIPARTVSSSPFPALQPPPSRSIPGASPGRATAPVASVPTVQTSTPSRPAVPATQTSAPGTSAFSAGEATASPRQRSSTR